MDFGKILTLISHAGLLIHTEHDVETIAKNIFVTHSEKFPTAQEFGNVLDDALQLLGIGIFNLPDDVRGEISQVLTAVKGQIPSAAATA